MIWHALSPSRMSVYKDCPLKFKKKYIEKNPVDRDSKKKNRGKLIHAWIESYINEGVEPDFSPEDFSQEMKEKVINFLKPSIEACHKSEHVYVSTEFEIAVDREFRKVPYDPSDIPFLRGIIDFVVVDAEKKAGVVIDWKSGKSSADPFQIEVYSLIFRKLLPVVDFSFYYYFVDRKRTEEATKIVVREEKEILGEINEIVFGIENEFFDAKPSFKCSLCDFNDECTFRQEKKKKRNIFYSEMPNISWLKEKIK